MFKRFSFSYGLPVFLFSLLTTGFLMPLDSYSKMASNQFENPGLTRVGSSVRLLSAFFGLDNTLPFRVNILCLGGAGLDGMPVVFSRTIDTDSLQEEDFRILTRSGAEHKPRCVTYRPADDAGELRTILLIGEFGDANDDPPVSVRVVGDLFSDGKLSAENIGVNFRGSNIEVTPLDAGPSIVLAENIPVNNLSRDTRGTLCPEDSAQVIRVTWDGGVRLLNREEPGDAERQLYQVTVRGDEGSSYQVNPEVLADLEDGDNNHLLCLMTEDAVISVSFPGGHLADPNLDLNPDTFIKVNPGFD